MTDYDNVYNIFCISHIMSKIRTNDSYVCSILGMNLFGCKFCSGKNDGTGTTDVACDRKNFDSLLWALVTVFQVPGTII